MIVYKITNKINGSRYIGQTMGSLEKRWKAHCRPSSGCLILKNAIQKYGKDNFTIEVVSRCCSLQELNHREAYYIKLFNTLSPNGYNLLTGGTSRRPSELTRSKMSESQKQRFKKSPQVWTGKNRTKNRRG